MSYVFPFVNVAYLFVAFLRTLAQTRVGQTVVAAAAFAWCYVHVKLIKLGLITEESKELKILSIYELTEDGQIRKVPQSNSSTTEVSGMITDTWVIVYKVDDSIYSVMVDNLTRNDTISVVGSLHKCSKEDDKLKLPRYIAVQADEQDITDIYRSYAGPGQDFYRSSTKSSFRPQHMINLQGELVFEVLPEKLKAISDKTYCEEEVPFESVFPSHIKIE